MTETSKTIIVEKVIVRYVTRRPCSHCDKPLPDKYIDIRSRLKRLSFGVGRFCSIRCLLLFAKAKAKSNQASIRGWTFGDADVETREIRLSKETREELRAYQQDLLERVRKVRCPRCSAKIGANCRADQHARGRLNVEVGWCHRDRHRNAKKAGHVAGIKLADR